MADPETKNRLISELLNMDKLESMLKDLYANYVIQTALDCSDPLQRNKVGYSPSSSPKLNFSSWLTVLNPCYPLFAIPLLANEFRTRSCETPVWFHNSIRRSKRSTRNWWATRQPWILEIRELSTKWWTRNSPACTCNTTKRVEIMSYLI